MKRGSPHWCVLPTVSAVFAGLLTAELPASNIASRLTCNYDPAHVMSCAPPARTITTAVFGAWRRYVDTDDTKKIGDDIATIQKASSVAA